MFWHLYPFDTFDTTFKIVIFILIFESFIIAFIIIIIRRHLNNNRRILLPLLNIFHHRLVDNEEMNENFSWRSFDENNFYEDFVSSR
jgi:hypothetical protein